MKTEKTSEEEVAEILRENITFSGQAGDYVIHGAIEKLIAWREEYASQKIAALQAGENFKKFTLQIESPTITTDYTVYEKQEIEQKPDFRSLQECKDKVANKYGYANWTQFVVNEIHKHATTAFWSFLEEAAELYVSPLYSRIKELEQQVEMFERAERIEANSWEERCSEASHYTWLDDQYQAALEKIKELEASQEKLKAFKDYVHNRLNEMGIEKDPESPHKAAGCRIGGRLDIVQSIVETFFNQK